ncbi:MAG: proline dehydrogenase family protein [Acidobacteria bacterium]|nr:proline dehydrogenase family protein [Acidobacteriota bacterium]
MVDFSIDFQDTKIAFADKTDAELREKYRLFKLMNSPLLNSIGTSAAKFALSIGLPIDGIIKRTAFEHFCGGETIEECQGTIARLGASGIGTILDYSVEGKTTEAEFDATKEEILRTIRRAKGDSSIPFAVFKVSGIAPFGTLEKLSARQTLDAKGQAKSENLHDRVREICCLAAKLEQPLFIDAEDSWIQAAIDDLATEMMALHNRGRVIVFNTIQLYRKDRLNFLREAALQAKKEGYMLGVKLVRGAYMEKERERAEEMGYDSPIHDDKASTDADYDEAIRYCLNHLDTTAFVAATHNEESCRRLARLMHERSIPHDHPQVFFSQLYGMSDNLSYVLAANGYNVSKYLPYGPVRDTVPYLIRRAQENTSVAGQMSRELDLLGKELTRRKQIQ